jgi:hypothetical protein
MALDQKSLASQATQYLALVAIEVLLAGAFFLVTPTGLLAFVAVAFSGPIFTPVVAAARLLVVVAVGLGTAGKILSRGFPIYAVQRS